MWYALVENTIDYYKENRLFFGETLETVAEKLMQLCEVAMQFDLEEMTMDDINGYYTEGYDVYEALEEAPTAELIASFRFQCNETEIRVLSLADDFDAFALAFEQCSKGRLREWKLASGLDDTMLEKLDGELKALSDGDVPEKLECFVKRR